ncbi:bile acid:sodium symporter family protein [Halocola ammonii]
MEEQLANLDLTFNESSLTVLNLCIAFIMFGVALTLKKKHFELLITSPKPVFTGMLSQFIVLPALTFVLVYFLQPATPLALGMILVAACPGGNVSNFFSMVGGGNTALSVTLTAIATVLAVVMTPLNFEVWSHFLYIKGFEKSFSVDPLDMFKTVSLIIGLPIIAGVIVALKLPKLTERIHKPIKWLSFLILLGFIGVAFWNNRTIFVNHFEKVIFLVFLHNAIAIGSGFYLAKALKNNKRDSRTISLETGIQNSGLALVIIFSFFGGNGGMAFIAAWWGVWHIVAGFIITRIFVYSDSRQTVDLEQ